MIDMNRKVIGVIVCVSILMLGSLPVMSADVLEDGKKVDLKSYLLEKTQKLVDDNITLPPNFVITSGPISKFITEFEVLDGPEKQTTKIEKLMNRKFVPFSRVIPVYVVFVFGMNFTIEYKNHLRFRSRFVYATVNGSVIFNESGFPEDITNVSYIHNQPHKIKVENFTGIFMFMHGRLIRRICSVGYHLFFIPARGSFIGYCDRVTYLPVPQ